MFDQYISEWRIVFGDNVCDALETLYRNAAPGWEPTVIIKERLKRKIGFYGEFSYRVRWRKFPY